MVLDGVGTDCGLRPVPESLGPVGFTDSRVVAPNCQETKRHLAL
jgi:hypothetical protein